MGIRFGVLGSTWSDFGLDTRYWLLWGSEFRALMVRDLAVSIQRVWS